MYKYKNTIIRNSDKSLVLYKYKDMSDTLENLRSLGTWKTESVENIVYMRRKILGKEQVTFHSGCILILVTTVVVNITIPAKLHFRPFI